jgi:hypothetical protein
VAAVQDPARSSSHESLTTVAIGFTLNVLWTLGHEALGHGGACVLVECSPVQVSGTYFQGNETGLSAAAIRVIALGGSVFNFVLGVALFAAIKRLGPRLSANSYYVLWYGALINLLSATGYVFFGSAFLFGDFSTVLRGAEPQVALRIGFTTLGCVLYLGSMWVMARLADPLLGSGPDRRSRLFKLVLLPQLVAGTILAGGALLSPYPQAAVFTMIGHVFPAVGAWGMLQWFVGNGTGKPSQEIVRSRVWWAAAGLMIVLAVAVVGPGLPRATLAEIEARANEVRAPR